MAACRDVSTRLARSQVRELPWLARLKVRAHLATCARCRAYAASLDRVGEGMKAALDTWEREMPGDLPDRVMAAMANAPAAPGPTAGIPSGLEAPVASAWNWTRVAAAAAVVVLMTAGAWWTVGRNGDGVWRDQLMTVAADYQDGSGVPAFASDDRAAVRDWLNERLPFRAHVPSIPGATLAGARLGQVNGRPAAALLFDVEGRLVSLYLMPAAASDPAPLAPEQVVGGTDADLAFIGWEGVGLVHTLVGPLPRARLRDMAQYCWHQA